MRETEKNWRGRDCIGERETDNMEREIVSNYVKETDRPNLQKERRPIVKRREREI